MQSGLSKHGDTCNDRNISGRRCISSSTSIRGLPWRQLWFHAPCIHSAKCHSVRLRHGADTLDAQGRGDFRCTWFYHNMDGPAHIMSPAWIYLGFMFIILKSLLADKHCLTHIVSLHYV